MAIDKKQNGWCRFTDMQELSSALKYLHEKYIGGIIYLRWDALGPDFVPCTMGEGEVGSEGFVYVRTIQGENSTDFQVNGNEPGFEARVIFLDPTVVQFQSEAYTVMRKAKKQYHRLPGSATVEVFPTSGILWGTRRLATGGQADQILRQLYSQGAGPSLTLPDAASMIQTAGFRSVKVGQLFALQPFPGKDESERCLLSYLHVPVASYFPKTKELHMIADLFRQEVKDLLTRSHQPEVTLV